ncbi:AarF/UbiB family protein [Alphaproteobacteria bacterium]|nr:AarF/UbiB family protein [Alphaproteobacteria bacterium]MDC0226586.1 AarF/UbiB family protein [Alphaproteobacteria bacterium]
MKDTESKSIGKQIKRYAKVGGIVGKLATKLASQKYLGVKLDKNKHAAEIRAALGSIKGPLMKVAQLSATIPDLLPPEYVEELMHLQSNAPPMGWLFVKRRMASELNLKWQDNFINFDKEATKAASLGQVHRAIMPNKNIVACKLQYPDMESAVSADLSQLKMIFSIYQSYNKAIKTDEVFKEITERLKEELDYIRERKLMNIFRNIFFDTNFIHVPKVIEKLSTKRLLTMTWLEGDSIIKFKNEKSEIRNTIAKNMFYAWYKPFYTYGIIHGDPHLGNYSIQKNLSVNLFDFGCMRIFKGKFIQGVIDLYFALQKNDQDKIIHAYEQWGFEDITKKKIEVLNKWAQFIYSPLMKDKIQKIQENDSGVYGAQVAARVHNELKKLGGIKPPKEFVFMDRAAVGLGSVFMHLKAEVNWYQVFNSLIEDFDDKEMDKRQQKALKLAKL